MRYSASCRGFKSRPLRHPPQLPFLPARSHGGLPRCRRKRSVLRLATLQRGHPLAIPGCCPGVARIRPERASLLRRRSASGRNRDPTRRAAARARDADRRRLRRRRVVMAIGGIAEIVFGLQAEGRALESIARPLTAVRSGAARLRKRVRRGRCGRRVTGGRPTVVPSAPPAGAGRPSTRTRGPEHDRATRPPRRGIIGGPC